MKKQLLHLCDTSKKTALKAMLFTGFLTSVFNLNAQTVTTIGQVSGPPSGIAVDNAGFVYIAERAPSSTITKLNQTTGLTSVFSNAGFNDPMDIEIGPNGELFVADFVSNSILKIPSSGGTATSYVTGAEQPVGLAFDGDTLYYIEYTSQLIFKVAPGGGAVGTSSIIQVTSTPLWMASGARGTGLTILSNGNLFVTAALHLYQYELDKRTGVIIYDIEGDDNTVFGASQLSDGNLYMPGNSSNKIYKWNYGSPSNSEFCGEGTSISVDGTNPSAAFDSPYFIANDANDNLYVTDYYSKKIRKISNAVASLNEFEDELISIYPNPTSSFLTIELKEISDLTIYSADGKIVSQLNNALNYSIDASSFKNGVYYVQTENGATQKFIKQ